jgi:hypothetical protein
MVLEVVVWDRSRTIGNKTLAAGNELEQEAHLRRISEFGSSCWNSGSSDGGVCSAGPGLRSSIIARRSSRLGVGIAPTSSPFVTAFGGGSENPDDRVTRALDSSFAGR